MVTQNQVLYYQHHVFVCTNQRDNGRKSCGTTIAHDMRDYLKKRLTELELHGQSKIRINNAGCLGRCQEGPVLVIYPEGIWYRYATQGDIEEILQQHLLHGQIVERLLLPKSP